MRAVIRRIRMSLFWSRHFGALLGAQPPPDAPMVFLGRRPAYRELFDRLAPGAALPPPGRAGPSLERPWPPQGTNRFWQRYLGAPVLADVKGGNAWRRLVPLRRHDAPGGALGVTPTPTEGLARTTAQAEGLFHAHGVTFALHVTLAGEMPLASAVKACVGLRLGAALTPEGSSRAVRADDLAGARLAVLCREAAGAAGPDLAGPQVGYSLVTVLEGDGVDPGIAIEEGDDVHRALDALTRWDPAWEVNPLRPLEANTIPREDTPAGHRLYGRGYGRAVWEPWAFLPANRRQTTLSCYHRNLFVGMVQTEALLRFAKLADDAADEGHLSAAQNELAFPAVEQLLALHAGGAPATPAYRSVSLRVQIDQHPLRPCVDALAARLGLQGRLGPVAPLPP